MTGRTVRYGRSYRLVGDAGVPGVGRARVISHRAGLALGGCGGLGYGSVGKLGTLDDASHWESEQERVTYHVDGRGLSRAGRLPGCSRDASGSQPSDL